ncbi:Protein KTI12 like [Rhynchospora pubera]|uniref:Protein KTI12 homolog n=1 Tax=Rhynchospora pubera TaxID=906938 RepID=A0AAV8ELQ9_9POAL|nr:Protein KTI12 like [Rhynchospora pubera]
MALVVMCGQPCSGKSTAAIRLSEALQSACATGGDQRLAIRIIDESSLHLGRNQSYADMAAEKNLRGVLRSQVDRSLSKDSIVIVDSLNNIKGYRYELWCLARASGIRYCVVFCDTEVDQCREWNDKRREIGQLAYDTNIFEDLARRFERPDSRNRWDSPLFELFPSRDDSERTSTVIEEAVSYLTKKVDSKTRDVKVLQPTIATQTAVKTEANTLYEMDKATQEVINAIVEAQSSGFGATVDKVTIGPDLPSISFFLLIFSTF